MPAITDVLNPGVLWLSYSRWSCLVRIVEVVLL